MSDKTALGDRMKAYEVVTRTLLPRRTYAVVRVDGRAFHSFLRHAERPFDGAVMRAMDAVAEALCAEMSGAVFAFAQSDECSVLLTDFESHGTQPWFGGVIQKVVSIAASTATVAFNRSYGMRFEPSSADGYATFDARVFTIPDVVEVANYYLWRQRDCVRNSITMAAQAKFSHKQLHGKSTGDMQEMLWSQHRINWNDYPDGAKRGRVCVRYAEERDATWTERNVDQQITSRAVRSRWASEAAPHFTATSDGWLASVIPAMPSLTAGMEAS
ncbi:tRNA(His) guanylyltransferase Thg1 family protein [Nonomuraea jiangxiensis]|uniref:tRNA(His) guanylyltransferase n=1 Tax=Nonomuraea jiangxiensis TaxID=633440 RepID=A0A1G9Q4W1_9ACTN|nr:tRNA(His) guanylyltransferase Thg1 family protein [Nonomuraea jiangxiensis]SDM06060.1 tRNA(His) 5'-end guanylyltransferase [Nonomuraea jiangxiensis]